MPHYNNIKTDWGAKIKKDKVKAEPYSPDEYELTFSFDNFDQNNIFSDMEDWVEDTSFIIGRYISYDDEHDIYEMEQLAYSVDFVENGTDWVTIKLTEHNHNDNLSNLKLVISADTDGNTAQFCFTVYYTDWIFYDNETIEQQGYSRDLGSLANTSILLDDSYWLDKLQSHALAREHSLNNLRHHDGDDDSILGYITIKTQDNITVPTYENTSYADEGIPEGTTPFLYTLTSHWLNLYIDYMYGEPWVPLLMVDNEYNVTSTSLFISTYYDQWIFGEDSIKLPIISDDPRRLDDYEDGTLYLGFQTDMIWDNGCNWVLLKDTHMKYSNKTSLNKTIVNTAYNLTSFLTEEGMSADLTDGLKNLTDKTGESYGIIREKLYSIGCIVDDTMSIVDIISNTPYDAYHRYNVLGGDGFQVQLTPKLIYKIYEGLIIIESIDFCEIQSGSVAHKWDEPFSLYEINNISVNDFRGFDGDLPLTWYYNPDTKNYMIFDDITGDWWSNTEILFLLVKDTNGNRYQVRYNATIDGGVIATITDEIINY